VPPSIDANSGLVVGSVPADSGTFFCNGHPLPGVRSIVGPAASARLRPASAGRGPSNGYETVT
jgi:hypothetical protein